MKAATKLFNQDSVQFEFTQKQPDFERFNNLLEVIRYFSDEQVCRDHLAELRWKDGQAVCPYCDHEKVYVIENGNRYKCANKKCYKKFSVTVGTIFENTKISVMDNTCVTNQKHRRLV